MTIAGNTSPNTPYNGIYVLDYSPPLLRNCIVYGGYPFLNQPTVKTKNSLIEGNSDTANGNLSAAGILLADVFTNPANSDYTLKSTSPAINAGDNSLYTGLATTIDLIGNARVYDFANGGIIDLGAGEYQGNPSIIYVRPTATGTGSGSSWGNATDDLHNAIHAAGVQKVFVAVGSYPVGSSSFIMKNGVEIYGGFDPDNGITGLSHSRIMPNASNSNGSILYGQNIRPVIWNVFTSATAMNNTAVLDGFTITGGSYSDGAGIRNIYASPILRNLVIRGNNTSATGAGVYNENSSPGIFNSVISGNSIISATAIYGAGIYNTANSSPVLANITIVNNLLSNLSSGTMGGAGIYSSANSSPKIYNSIIWNNKKLTSASTAGADIEGGAITLKNSITQSYTTGITSDNNKVGVDPLLQASFSLQLTSPAINSGSNAWLSAFGGTTGTDLAGNPRLFSSAVDIGAYEFNLLGGIIYVKPTATGTGDGTSWANATNDLHNAIHIAGATKVFVAVGNYNTNGTSFIMQNGVTIYGGFDPANGINSLNDNRILPNKGMGDGSILNGGNANPVIWNYFTEATALDNTAVLDGFTLMNGYINGNGGGIHNNNASPIFTNLVIRNNKGIIHGGGVYTSNGSPVFTNVKITDNITYNSGAGMYIDESSSVTATNIQITNNYCDYNAGEALCVNSNSASAVFINATIANNARNALSNNFGTLVFKNSIIFGGYGINHYTAFTAYNSLIPSGESNSNIDITGIPAADIFSNPSGKDYTLKFGSAAINRGDNTFYTGLTADTKDLMGNIRVYNYADGGVIDMGAYESPYNATILTPDANGIIYVKEAYTGIGDGSSWANATDNLRGAINVAGVQKVFAAVGNYNVNGTSFIMKNGVEIYGGFDPANNIIDLDDARILLSSSGGSVLNGQATSPVIRNVFASDSPLDNTAVLDGFTIKNGFNNASGGGMYNIYASPTLRNLLITNNNSSEGGGMYNTNSSSPAMTNITMTSNTATNDGGAMYNDASASPVLINVTITGNTAKNGAGIYNRNTSLPILVNVKITGNESSSSTGGAIQNEASSSSTLINVTIADNIHCIASFATDGTTTIYNSIIFGGITRNKYSAQNSLIEGNEDSNNGNIVAGINDVFTDNTNGNYTLKSISPAINAGNNALFLNLNANTKDLAGNPRVYHLAVDGIIDLGAYEYQGDPIPLPVTLVNYTAKAQGNKVKLQWATTMETNSKEFIISRSLDGKTFVETGKTAGAGNSSIQKNYTFYDNNPANGMNYYRLQQKDFDGRVTDHGIRKVEFSMAPKTVKLYPNPVRDILKIEFSAGEYQQIELTDNAGRVLQRVNLSVIENQKTIRLANYASGVYFVRLIGAKTIVQKVVKE